MGGARVTFTINRSGRDLEMSIRVPYRPSDTGARADANLTQVEVDLARQAVQGLIAQGIQVTGDSFTIEEDDSDLHSPPTARATQRVPAAILFGQAGAVTGAPSPVPGVALGGVCPTAEVIAIDGLDEGRWHGRRCTRQPDGTWRLTSPMGGPTGPQGANPAPNPPPTQPVTTGGAGPERRTVRPGGGGHHGAPARPPVTVWR